MYGLVEAFQTCAYEWFSMTITKTWLTDVLPDDGIGVATGVTVELGAGLAPDGAAVGTVVGVSLAISAGLDVAAGARVAPPPVVGAEPPCARTVKRAAATTAGALAEMV